MAPMCVPQCGALRDPYSAQLLSAMALMQIGSGYNVVAISGAELIWTSEGELYTWTSSVLDAAIFLGFVVGTLSMGRYADLKGRLAAQRVSCLFAAVGAVASALAGPRHGRYVEIACFRFLLGIGAGGAAPIAASYTYERLREVERAAGGPLVHDPRTSGGPASATGSMDIWNLAGQAGSYLVAILLMSCGGWMSKKAMWRSMLGLGALPFLLSAFLTRDAEESRAFARLGDRRLGAGWADFRKALAARDPTGPAKLFDVVLVVFCYQLVCYGLLLLLPDLVEAAIVSPTNREILGVLAALSAVGIFAAYSSLGPIDSLGAAAVLERTLVFSALVTWAFALGLGFSSSTTLLLVLCFAARRGEPAVVGGVRAAVAPVPDGDPRPAPARRTPRASSGARGNLTFTYIANALGDASLLAICASSLVLGAFFMNARRINENAADDPTRRRPGRKAGDDRSAPRRGGARARPRALVPGPDARDVKTRCGVA
ncbi:hypothetical protein JL720_9660 [Aureococcus anophagefferens]|nr:hypothetical protein JL720_9660 [Aureococcus anophagefferens]